MDNDMFNLTGRTALVTGGSRGLGREMALAFAKKGANVAIVSRKLENCQAVAEEVRALGRKAIGLSCHVGHWDELETTVEKVVSELGSVDLLVNNAGLSPTYPSLDSVTEELFDKVIGLNLKGPFRLMALVGKQMMENAGGAIINVSSVAAIAPSPGSQPYGAAKAGLNSLTQAFAHAYGPKVRVNCIMAGPFLTDISKAWDMDVFGERAKRMPLRRGGNPDEVIGAALYLASDASSFTTGSVLTVDGGWTGGDD